MSIHVALNHVTHYRYDRPIHLGPQVVRLRPAPHSRTRILSYSMRVEPATHFINWQQDPQSNYLARLCFRTRRRRFASRSIWSPRMAVLNPFDFFLEPSAEHFRSGMAPELAVELAPYLIKAPETQDSPAFAAYLADIPRTKTPTNDFLVALNQGLQRDIGLPGAHGAGVQDAGGDARESERLVPRHPAGCWWQLLRHLGLAARFVSGYLIQLKSDVKSLDGPSGTEVDFTDLHAWCEGLPARRRLDRPRSDLGPARRRRPHPARMLARARLGGAGERCNRRLRNHVRAPHVGRAGVGSAARHAALYRGAVVGDRSPGPAGRRRPAPQRRAAHARRRAHFRLGRRPRRRGVEHRGDGPTKRLLSAKLIDKLRLKYGDGGLLHYRPGQVVSGRAVAALVAEPVLAQGP